MRPFIYVAILAGKRGELTALRELPSDTFDQVMPLVEIPARPRDWEDDGDSPGKTLEQHFETVVKNLVRGLEGRPSVWIDLPNLVADEDQLASGEHPIENMFARLRGTGVTAVPVTGPDRLSRDWDAVRDIARRDGRGAVIRVKRAEFTSVVRDNALSVMLDDLELTPNDVDLVLDVEAIDEDQVGLVTLGIAQVVQSAAVQALPWRSLTLASGGFPTTVKSIDRGVGLIARADLMLWRDVRAALNSTARVPLFGDYGIQAPGLQELNPKFLTVSANIRYTDDADWIVARGRPIIGRPSVKVPYEEYRTLARAIARLPEFRGAAFSPGDQALALVAANQGTPGSPETWRRHGTSHHLVQVAQQMAAVVGPVGAGA